MGTDNRSITDALRLMASAYEILGENRFRIIAYERAAESISHLPRELYDIWMDGKMTEIPGIGTAIAGHLDELFRTGRVTYFEEVLAKVPRSVFALLAIPGIGPKKASRLVTALALEEEADPVNALEARAKEGAVAGLPGFGAQSEADIIEGIALLRKGETKEHRMPLSDADRIARELLAYLAQHPSVLSADVLGSLRRMCPTIGDIDIAVATRDPEGVIGHFLAYPHQRLIEQGPTGASVTLVNGRQVDVRVQDPASYGSMLQYFTGSKAHNIALRTYAKTKGKSLSEYGIKDVATGRIKKTPTEKAFYGEIGLEVIAPELREDTGEIEAAIAGNLPNLVTPDDMKGDLHLHSDYNLFPSHDLGKDPLVSYLDRAKDLGYAYIGMSEHNPSVSTNTESRIVEIMKKRKAAFDRTAATYRKTHGTKAPKLLVMCEVDIRPDGTLALPESAFAYVDAVIVSIHSSFDQDKQTATRRVVRAIASHPKVRVLGHPTGRLIGKRDGLDLDWEAVFAHARQHDVAIEINAHPMRLDASDTVVREGIRSGVKFLIDTDAHDVRSMDLMRFGVSVARRGWATKDDILNTYGYNEFVRWLVRT